jgi:WD40 repeat protein
MIRNFIERCKKYLLKIYQLLFAQRVPNSKKGTGADIYSKNSVANQTGRGSVFRLVVSHRSENSILDNPGNLIPYEVGNRKRYATCSGVSWFDKDHLAVINLYGQHARIYKLISDKTNSSEPWQLKLVYEFNENINYPEDLSVAKNHKYVAITNTLSDTKGVSIFEMDPVSFHFTKLLNRICVESTCHGIRFSPDSKYLVFTIIDPPGAVKVYAVSDIAVIPAFTLENPDPQQRPKAVCFTPDSKFIAVLYSYAAGIKSNNKNNKSSICIHRYVQDTGKIDRQLLAQYIHQSETNSAFEIGAFRAEPNQYQYSLFITDQEDRVFEFKFDSQNRNIQLIGSFGDDLPFPHGIDLSPDGHYLAVTTLGDDIFKIFELNTCEIAVK